MTVLVTLAGESDLEGAERLMRQVLEEDLGGYRREWHRDVDDLSGAYLTAPRAALFVARLGGEVVGTAAIRPCRLQSPPNPAWLARRFSVASVCELRRVWVGAGARRRGVARALVAAATRWAVEDGGFEEVYLHTDTGAPGAEAFWRALPTTQVHDARPDPFNCVHFVLDVAALQAAPVTGASTRAGAR